MQVMDRPPVPFDVDKTLILWGEESGNIPITCPYTKRVFLVKPHDAHIHLLKKKFMQGDKIMVWSATGGLWAKAVVDALGLAEYVNFTWGKFVTYVDDLPVEAWMKDRIYVDPNDPWGKQ